MKKLILILSVIAFLFYSCKKEPKEDIRKDVEISLAFSILSCKCNGTGMPTVEILGGGTYIYNPNDISNEIKSQTDWQNKEYIATLKVKDETCECVLGVDPIPGNDPPTEDLQKVKILKIREK